MARVRGVLSACADKFQKRLWKAFDASQATDQASDVTTQLYARFILDSGHLSSRGVRHQAFLPRKSSTSISVFDVVALSEPEIWNLGDEVVGKPRNKVTRARADIEKEGFLSVGLTVVSSPAPHPRHYDVCGWPPHEQKDLRKDIAQDLADVCKRIDRPSLNTS
jgi:hypothetical protein